MASNNPFFADAESCIPSTPLEPAGIKKRVQSKPRTSAKSTTSSKGRKTTAPSQPSVTSPPTAHDLFGSESESESEAPASLQPIASTSAAAKRKRKYNIFPDSEDEQERGPSLAPVRASALKSFLSRRTGSGYTLQSDPTRRGAYYIELRVYNSREVESLLSDRWKHSLVTYKCVVDENTPVWQNLHKLIDSAKEEFKTIQPILYPNNIY